MSDPADDDPPAIKDGTAAHGDVPSRGVSHLPEQAEDHMLSVPLQAAESAEYR